MFELASRPEVLEGKTYQIKPPVLDHSLFITINDMVKEDGTRKPFEIFINSKNMDGYQWVVGITRMMSALLRHDIDPYFLVDELNQVFDPQQSYYIPGGKFVKSVVCHLGIVFEEHCKSIGIQRSKKSKINFEGYSEQYIKDNTSTCPSCKEETYVDIGGYPQCSECGYPDSDSSEE